jgi:N,N'-diacetyllegionaminate synthase
MKLDKKIRKTIIIAEAGVNHNGNMHNAKKLIDIASKAGADYVKFQTFDVKYLILKKTKTASYQKKNLNKKISQYNMLKKYQLTNQNHLDLIKHAKKKKIKFLSTAFEIKSLNLLKKFKLDYIKIPSGEITNYPLLKRISNLKQKILLSTGMSTLKEIKQALKILRRKKKDITILHCTSDYPANIDDLNLNFIHNLKKLGYAVGYSDHSENIITPSIAVSLGCKVVEKHFTISKKLKGPDHKASLEPKELIKMIKFVRQTEKILGSKNKVITKSEQKTKLLVRKSLVASKIIEKGEIFNKQNLTTKRPGNGLSPFLIKKFLGKKSLKKYKKDQQI